MFADTCYLLDSKWDISITRPFRPFLSEVQAGEWTISVDETDSVLDFAAESVSQMPECRAVRTETGFDMVFRNTKTMQDYAVSRMDIARRRVDISVRNADDPFVCETGNIMFFSQWERILLEERKLILHASCVETQFGGILFSGPSGIGKSTQSDLWIAEENARLINGDRPILGIRDGLWHAYGSPYAGSSKCHVNASVPVRCIVMLEQGSENRIRRLPEREAFRRVYRNLTVYTWDPEFVSGALDLASRLISEIPVYELTCLPNADAVACLKRELTEGDR